MQVLGWVLGLILLGWVVVWPVRKLLLIVEMLGELQAGHRALRHQVGHLYGMLHAHQEVVMADLSEITGKVEKIIGAGDSLKVLVLELKAALDAAGTDPVQLKALSDAMEAKAEEWAAAVAANPVPEP